MARHFSDDQSEDREPRIVFATLSNASGPILSGKGYQIATATSFSIWFLMVVMVWVFHLELSISKDLVLSLASTAASLSALALAVVGLLQGFNRTDKWFKAGLLLVATMFAAVVLGGYYLGMTWEERFNLPQRVTFVVVVVLAIAMIFQHDWILTRRLSKQDRTDTEQALRWAKRFQKMRIAVQFSIPVCVCWISGVNRLTFVILLFVGASLALIILMLVTTYRIARGLDEQPKEDPFLTVLRKRYESEIRHLVRVGEVKTLVLQALDSCQQRETENARKNPDYKIPLSIDSTTLSVRLRQMHVDDHEHILTDACGSLVSDGMVIEDTHGYWSRPTEERIRQVVQQSRLPVVVTRVGQTTRVDKDECIMDGMLLTDLRKRMSGEFGLPLRVLDKHIMPLMAATLNDTSVYVRYLTAYQCVFCLRHFALKKSDIDELLVTANKSGTWRVKVWLESLGGHIESNTFSPEIIIGALTKHLNG